VKVEVVLVESAVDDVLRDELWPLYRRIFGDFDDLATWRDRVWDRHSARDGFRLALARDDGELVRLSDELLELERQVRRRVALDDRADGATP